MSAPFLPTARRGAATVVALGVGVAGLALLPSPPAVAAEPLTFDWEISPRFDDHLSTHTLADGATEDADGVVTFPDGEGTYDPVSGVTEVSFGGSVEGVFAAGGTPFYGVTVADPTVSVDASGAGEISAVVSAWNAAAGPNPAASTTPTRVVVTTFEAAAGDWTAADGIGTLTDTPDWTGVLPSGAESAALGIPDGQPLEGKAFAPAFLGQLTPGVRAHFYASGSGSDPAKAPSAFTVTAAEAKPMVELGAVAIQEGTSVTVPVSGSGFRAVTLPGDAGVYVGLAPAGGLPDLDDMNEGIAYFSAASYVLPGQLADGSFTTDLVAPIEKLDPRKDYAVYTWQAHTHSNPTQDTETPVLIAWDELGFPLDSRIRGGFAKKPTPTKAGKLAVSVRADGAEASGRVVIKLVKGKATHVWRRPLENGAVAVRVPRLARGIWTLRVAYRGTAVYDASELTRKVRITR